MCEKKSLWCSYQSIIFNLKQHPVYPCFAILTAFNPRSIVLSKKDNLVRHQKLELALKSQVEGVLPISCSAPDGQWHELGFIVPMSKAEACREAKRWGQNAIYWVEDNELFLVPVLLDGVETQRLGDWPSFLYT
ncbi:DUF3293 domain-containing protein [Photobacterium rosenbergii]|uniref:DUF3293 domain-containing protein n=1 Tax=Photobacterium rosenbergii TaxID=294936 RepID=A0A2T3N7D2_9GAMM|nr:DUF3293 domain-containing protein [Photobacterium rosenbergii]PSW08889.1 DUF3293 domain-containing protein [Photobacterium rosenbergii]